MSPRDFNPLSPHGERPLHVAGERYAGHISIHSPHTGRDQAALELLGVETISIHSPHTGRDPPQRGGNARPHSDFNPLSPHGERHMRTKTAKSREKFQSTLPTRGETLFLPPGYVYGFHFNPLSPHGERPGRDGKLGAYAGRFQSTLPTRGETPSGSIPSYGDLISIHSPHTGRDRGGGRALLHHAFQSTLPTRGETHRRSKRAYFMGNFNPLSPHGERRIVGYDAKSAIEFQSTLPTRGETSLYLIYTYNI